MSHPANDPAGSSVAGASRVGGERHPERSATESKDERPPQRSATQSKDAPSLSLAEGLSLARDPVLRGLSQVGGGRHPERSATKSKDACRPQPEIRPVLARDLAHALDPAAFSRSLGIEPDPWQAGVLRWSGKRLVLNCARQTGKSTTAATLALHCALYVPRSLILLVSPSLRQSTELFRKVGVLLARLPAAPSLVEDNRLSCVFANRSRIVSLPSSEATIRGFSGAALIVEDEASRVSDDLYRAVRPMLATSGGRLILMSTPYGKRGHFWEAWSGGPESGARQGARRGVPAHQPSIPGRGARQPRRMVVSAGVRL